MQVQFIKNKIMFLHHHIHYPLLQKKEEEEVIGKKLEDVHKF